MAAETQAAVRIRWTKTVSGKSICALDANATQFFSAIEIAQARQDDNAAAANAASAANDVILGAGHVAKSQAAARAGIKNLLRQLQIALADANAVSADGGTLSAAVTAAIGVWT